MSPSIWGIGGRAGGIIRSVHITTLFTYISHPCASTKVESQAERNNKRVNTAMSSQAILNLQHCSQKLFLLDISRPISLAFPPPKLARLRIRIAELGVFAWPPAPYKLGLYLVCDCRQLSNRSIAISKSYDSDKSREMLKQRVHDVGGFAPHALLMLTLLLE